MEWTQVMKPRNKARTPRAKRILRRSSGRGKGVEKGLSQVHEGVFQESLKRGWQEGPGGAASRFRAGSDLVVVAAGLGRLQDDFGQKPGTQSEQGRGLQGGGSGLVKQDEQEARGGKDEQGWQDRFGVGEQRQFAG